MSNLEEILEIEDIQVFRVLNNRFRHRIMRGLVEPKSVKDLAAALDVPVTRLYYHVNQLADAGLIRVVEERKVGAMIERVYQTTARSFRPGHKLLESGVDPAEMARIAAAVVLDPARLDAEAMLVRHFAEGLPDPDLPSNLGRGQAIMSRSRAEEFAKRLDELLNELEGDDRDDDALEFSFSFVFAAVGVAE
jgi:DNA-binding transcriptional ArsR family regulator